MAVGLHHGLVVPDIAAMVPIGFAAGALHHQTGMHIRTVLQCRIGISFQCYCFAAAHALVGGDQDAGISIQQAVFQCFRREAAKHHRMHRANPGAGQHGVGSLGNHRHVDADSIAFFHATGFQHIGKFADLLVQFAVADVL